MNWDPSICRVCLTSESSIVSLHVKIELKNDYTYMDLFNSCTRLEARQDDDLPKNICHRCSNDLVTSFEFMNRAVSSDQFLRRSLENEYSPDPDEDDVEGVKMEDTSPSAEAYCEESVEVEDESDYQIDLIKENAFEIVQCGPLLYEGDVASEEYDKKSEENVEAEFCVEYVSNEESINVPPSTMKSPVQGNRTTECEICGKVLKRWSMKHHYRRCHKKEKLHLCSACPKTFTISGDLKIHMKTHDKERERSFICTICRKGFFEKQSLTVHMLRHTGVRQYQCEICEKKFTTKKSLEVHEFTHNRQSGKFVCKYCGKRFPSNADLTVHERFHTGDYPYKCELCDKSYAVKSHYNYHVAKHKGITYKCDQCDKEFMNRGSLTAHKFKHRDRMPHECQICKKGFASPFKLNRHQNCHKSKTEVQIE